MTEPDKYELLNPQLEVEITYSRTTSVHNGYRGQFYYDGHNWDALQQFIGKDTCNPGETVQVYLQTLSPDFHVGKFFVGKEFEIREGAKIVGRGKVTKILRDDFNYWDGSTFLKSLDLNIKPYSDSDDLLGFRIDFEVWLSETEIVDKLEFEMTGNPECMMLVKCKLIDKELRPRTVAEKIIECWKTRLATNNQLFKIDLELKTDSIKLQSFIDKFVLTFATWHSIYLTGQIIVTG